MNSCTTTSTNKTAEIVTEASSQFVAFVLRQLDVARLRALLAVNEIEMTITALSGGIISAEASLLILHESGLSLVEASS